jgi:hypothetical protein
VGNIDTGTDFIQPEFLNILFFEQKNLVIFPYVDLKHLHALEIFAVGYNIIDLESTALYNLKEIIEFETNNCYSQNRTLFFIYNLNKERIQEILSLSGIRCIVNTHDNVADLVQEGNYIFYNKKNKTFLNYKTPDSELTFENYLISSSENETLLNEALQQIKMGATKIFTEINKTPDRYDYIPEILNEFPLQHWEKILDFTRHYFHIEIPVLNFAKKRFQDNNFQDHPSNFLIKSEQAGNSPQILREFEFITNLNKYIADEFVQVLLEYRVKKVNPQHLDLEQLYHPQKIYLYLRTHHWKEEIDVQFVKDWVQMKFTGYTLTEQDLSDFEQILEKFKIPKTIIANIPTANLSSFAHSQIHDQSTKSSRVVSKELQGSYATLPKFDTTPSLQHFEEFRKDLLEKLGQIDSLIDLLTNKDK